MINYSSISPQCHPFATNVSTSSDDPEPGRISLQEAWDNNMLNGLRQCANLAQSRNLPLYVTIQGHAYRSSGQLPDPNKMPPGIGGIQGDWRFPSQNENRCMVNLALSCGAKGLLYWKYVGSAESPALVNGNAEGGQRSATLAFIRVDTGPYIDRMGRFFAALKWRGSALWGRDTLPGSEIVQITDSLISWDSIPTYLQVSKFESDRPTEESYYFIVNRRCESIERFTETVYFQPAFSSVSRLELPDLMVTDMETDSTFLAVRATPNYWFSIDLEPGQGRLLRFRQCHYCPGCIFGDADGNGSISVADATFIINYIFASGPAPQPIQSGDAACDGGVTVADAVYLINFIFSGGPPPCQSC